MSQLYLNTASHGVQKQKSTNRTTSEIYDVPDPSTKLQPNSSVFDFRGKVYIDQAATKLQLN